MRGLLKDTLTELLHRKIIYVFLILTLMWIIGAVGMRFLESSLRAQATQLSEMGSLKELLLMPALSMHMYILVFVAALTAAAVIPRMFVSGRADYYLSKPISRASLLLKKTAAVLIIYGALMLVSFILDFTAMSLSFSFFEPGVFYIALLGAVSLFIWLAVTTLAGIATGSYSMSIIAAFFAWVAQKVLGFHNLAENLIQSKPVVYVIKVLYYIVPKTSEISEIGENLAAGNPVDWMPIWSSLLFAFAALYVAVLIFRRKDY